MRIVTLVENTARFPEMNCEHGLSLYIEFGEYKILFDAGQTGIFADNAERLGIDLAQVDFAILSHGHYDHGGGMLRFLECNQTAPIYLSTHAFGDYYNGTEKYIGLPPELQRSGRLVYTADRSSIAPGITLISSSCLEPAYPVESFGLNRKENGCFLPDDFRHEQYLLLEDQGRRVCISGCSHRGILNIVSWFEPDVLIGGFHFVKLDPNGAGRSALEASAKKMLSFPTQYYTGHCTGNEQYAFLKQYMGDRLAEISTGVEILI